MRTKLATMLAAAALAACSAEEKKSVPDVTVTYGGLTDVVALDSEAQVGALALAARDASKAVSGSASTFAGMAGVVQAPAFGVKQAMERVAAARRQTAATFAGVTGLAVTVPCEVEGTMTVSFSDTDDDLATTTVGDYWELSFSNCWNADGSGIDGAFRLTATTNGGDWSDPALVQSYSTFGFGLNFANLVSVAGNRYSGLDGEIEYTYAVDPASAVESFAMTGSHIAGLVGDAGSGAIWEAFLLRGLDGGDYSDQFVAHYADPDFLDLSWFEYGFNGEVCSTQIGGCLEVGTDPLFAQYANEPYPDDGLFWISAGFEAVQIEARDGVTGDIWVTLDLGGPHDGTWDTTWACLETEPDASVCFTTPVGIY
jgi:hypothetical protein